MLFNSDLFILVFLPFWLLVMATAPLKKRFVLTGIICFASLVFYAGDGIRNVPILIGSVLINFAILHTLILKKNHRFGVCLAVIFNLGFLGFYKYSCFILGSLPMFESASCTARLPLGISFFTFQQMAMLIDIGRRRKKEHDNGPENRPENGAENGAAPDPIDTPDQYKFSDYFSFVSFFPQLIAGPIVREDELMEPIRKRAFHVSLKSLEIGGLIFLMGLFKKVFLADSAAAIANPLFAWAEKGPVDAATAWLGTYAFTFQIYFDFSGYSDMAVGLAAMVGISLPWNFNKPYRATSPIAFWRRWHITLSRFLRDYLYIPLGGSRKGKGRKYINLMITMVLGGLWHGAAWTFVIWGAAHGALLAIAHGLQALTKNLTGNMQKLVKGLGWFFTFHCVSIIWIFFRAQSFEGAKNMFRGLINFEPTVALMRPLRAYWVQAGQYAQDIGIDTPMQSIVFKLAVIHLAILFCIAVFWPRNTKTIRSYEHLMTKPTAVWIRPLIWAILAGMLAVALYLVSNGAEKFIYFNF